MIILFCNNSDYKEYNTDTTIKFVVTMNPEKLQKAENEGVHKFFKLHSSIGLTSMVNVMIYSLLTCK